MDAYAIWAAAEGKSVRKSVATFWPELAAALDARAGTAAGDDENAQPVCFYCPPNTKRNAVGRTSKGKPLCGMCAGYVGREDHPIERVHSWRPGRARP